MKRKLAVLVFFGLIVFVVAFGALYSTQPLQYLLKIDKTTAITNSLQQHPEINILLELNTCYIGLTDKKNLSTLTGLDCTYQILAHTTGANLFLLNLRDMQNLSLLKQHGLTFLLEGNNVLFQPADSQHPHDILPAPIRGIKKLVSGVTIGRIHSPYENRYKLETISAIDPTITEMANKVSQANIEKNIRTLQNFVTRDAETNGCKLAGDFLANNLTQLGLQVEKDTFSFEGYSSRNIIGYLPGKTTPSAIVIICAHYDSYAEQNSTTNAPGADDNASGTAAVLEAAKIMAGYHFNYSIKFILFSAEEWGLYGSAHYAKAAASRGEKIVGVINLDMVSFTDALPEDLDVIVNANSRWIATVLESAAQNYSTIDVATTVDGSYDYSDHSSFWDRGFAAVLCIEDYEDTNPYYHTKNDTINTINLSFATQATRTCLAATAQLAVPSSATTPTITVTSPNGGEQFLIGFPQTITWTTTGTVGPVKLVYSANNGSSWNTIISTTANDGSYSWTVPDILSTQCLIKISEAADGSPWDSSNANFSIVSASGAQIGLSRTSLYFGALPGGPKSSPQAVWISNIGIGLLHWSASTNADWVSCSPTSGTNTGYLTVTVNPGNKTPGNYNALITITNANAATSAKTITVILTIKSSGENEAPFGEFATPVDGSTVRSSFPVTGWVLDDLGIANVKIYREEGSGLVFIGDAVLVEGARPDVAGYYPSYPGNEKAGWGYMLLSYFLPGGGNGVFKLHAIATDIGGYVLDLGVKTITVDNKNSKKPFGTIDTPAQGGIASGTQYINWGWVLTPKPNTIATNGTTITVWVDGENKGHPTYNLYRSDIATLFPGYNNSNGAVGYFTLDTTRFANGIHSMQWSATDSGGNTDGVGSRFFLINNGAADATPQRIQTMNQLADFPVSSASLALLRGYKNFNSPEVMQADESGIFRITIKELERIQIQHTGNLGGYMIVNGQLQTLPVGSTLDREKGVFYWQPVVGFLGTYHLVFIQHEQTGQQTRQEIMVTISPKFAH